MKTLAALLWLACGLAAVSWHYGNETAASGVVGAGLCAIACTVLAVIERA